MLLAKWICKLIYYFSLIKDHSNENYVYYIFTCSCDIFLITEDI